MKKVLTAALIICWSTVLTAQSIERQVISSSGTFAEVAWGSASSTIGEVVIETASSASVVLTQGFQQPLLSDTVSSVFDLSPLDVKIFPNPTNGELFIKTTLQKRKTEIYDGSGRLVLSVSGEQDILDISAFERGVYTVALVLENRVYHARIIKQ